MTWRTVATPIRRTKASRRVVASKVLVSVQRIERRVNKLNLTVYQVFCDIGNDHDHSSSQLSVHQALTCPEGQRAWALVHSLFGEMLAPRRMDVSRFTGHVPLGIK